MKIELIIMAGMLTFLSILSCSNSTVEELTAKSSPITSLETDFINPLSKDSILIDIHNNLFYNYISRLDRDQYLNNRLFLLVQLV